MVPIAPAVIVTDAQGSPLAGTPITFAVESGGGSATGTEVITGADGSAQVGSWTLGTIAGDNVLAATSSRLPGQVVRFRAVGVAGEPASLEFLVSLPAAGRIGVSFAPAPRLALKDQFGNQVARTGITVSATVVQGAGALSGPHDVFTDALGHADFTGLGVVGVSGSYTIGFAAVGTPSLEAVVIETPGPPASLELTVAPPATADNGVPLSPAPGLRLLDASGNQVLQSGVIVTVSLIGGGSLAGTIAVPSTSSGAVSFSDLVMTGPPGTKTLTFSTSGLPAIQSGPITLAAGGPADLSIQAGDNQSGEVTSVLPITPAVIVTDLIGNPVSGIPVTFNVESGGGIITGGSVTTDLNGIAAVGSWRLGPLVGTNTLSAATPGLSPVLFTATSQAGFAAEIVLVTGDQQTAVAGSPVPIAPQVRVNDAQGNPVAGTGVTFQVLSGGGSVTGSSATTNSAGLATVGSWNLGTTPGPNALLAIAPGLLGSPVTFSANGIAGPADSISEVAGNGQSAPVSSVVAVAPSVMVADANGNPVQGITVQFTVTAGNGILTGASPTTDAAGIARVGSWTLGPVPGTNGLDAAVSGLAGSPVHFSATGVAVGAPTMTVQAGQNQTAVVGTQLPIAPAVKVTDAGGNPAPGIVVTFTLITGGGSATGTTATTDINGVAAVGSWTLGSVTGNNRMRTTSPGVIGSPVIFLATAVSGGPTDIALEAGNGQSATAGTAVPIPPSVRVTDALGNPVAGIQVTYAITAGGGLLSGATPTTSANGIAALGGWTLGPVAGPNGIEAAVTGLQGSPVPFSATGLAAAPGPPDAIQKQLGDGQTVPAGGIAPDSLVVSVVDSAGAGVPNVPITWQVSAGGGSVSPPAGNTDASGRAATRWTAGSGLGTRTITATAAGLSAVFTGTVTAGNAIALEVVTPPAGALTGLLFATQPVIQLVDAGGNPVALGGVSVQANKSSGSALAILAGNTTAITAANGRATFTNLALIGPIGGYTIGFSSAGLTGASSGLALGSPSGRVPLTDMGSLTYLGFSGGLYPGGNSIPVSHATVGAARARNVRRLNSVGAPSPTGRYVLLSIGMSNTSQEWCNVPSFPCNSWTLTGRANVDAAVNHTGLVIADGAAGNATADNWESPNAANYIRVRDSVLAPLGVTEAQVQVVWLKAVNSFPTLSLPGPNAEADNLVTQYGNILRALRNRYPNLQIVFLSSRIYGGYATNGRSPEPFAYESGFAVKWVIQAQMDQMANGGTVVDSRAGNLNFNSVAPWIAWGPYMWAEGLNPRSDGATWAVSEFEADGTHPDVGAETKVGGHLLTFFKTDPRASCWFLAGATCP